MEGGSQLRTAVNAAESVPQLQELIEASFLSGARPVRSPDLVTR